MIQIMRFIVAIAVAFLLCLPSHSFSQSLVGQDYLGFCSAKFPSQTVADILPAGMPVGILDYTFGNQTSAIHALLSSKHPMYLRVHLLNNTCVRNRNCGAYEPLYNYSLSSLESALLNHNPNILNHVKARTLIYKSIQDSHPSTQILLSPILEHNLSKKAWRVLADAVLSVWPEAILVNSGMRGVVTESYRDALIERHGIPVEVGGLIYSHDGSEASDIKINSWLRDTRGALIAFTWTRSYNLRTQNPVWVDPRLRTAAPTKRILIEMLHITDVAPIKPKPTFKCNFKLFDTAFIWKPLAEDKGTGDVRANYPVLITKYNVSVATLVNFRGQKVAALGKYPVNYTDGRFRYYSKYIGGSGLGGYQIQEKAVFQSGSPYTYFKVGTSCYGPILTGRRQGSFR